MSPYESHLDERLFGPRAYEFDPRRPGLTAVVGVAGVGGVAGFAFGGGRYRYCTVKLSCSFYARYEKIYENICKIACSDDFTDGVVLHQCKKQRLTQQLLSDVTSGVSIFGGAEISFHLRAQESCFLWLQVPRSLLCRGTDRAGIGAAAVQL